MPQRVRTLRPRGAATSYDVRREADRRRAKRLPWRGLYSTSRWREIRQAQLLAEPLCRMCLGETPSRVTPATVCDHVNRHDGDALRFFAGPFQSLCKLHHDRDKQRIERGGAV